MSEALELYFEWRRDRWNTARWVPRPRGWRFCTECDSIARTQQSLYCSHHVRTANYQAKHRKGIVTGQCKKCHRDIPNFHDRSRKQYCTSCLRIVRRRVHQESCFRRGLNKSMDPRWRRRCSYPLCSEKVTGGGTATYCTEHRKQVPREKHAIEVDKLRRANMQILESAVSRLTKIRDKGSENLTHQDIYSIHRIAALLAATTLEPRQVKRRKQDKGAR